MEVPDPRYVRAADGAYIAYQVVGDGAVDVAWQVDAGGCLDVWWELGWVRAQSQQSGLRSDLVLGRL